MVVDIVSRVSRWYKLPEEKVPGFSGHSIRVGATQELLAPNIDLASVMHAGRWKSTHIAMRYGRRLLVAKGALAHAS